MYLGAWPGASSSSNCRVYAYSGEQSNFTGLSNGHRENREIRVIGSGLEFKAHVALMRHASLECRWHPLAAPGNRDRRITAFVPCFLTIFSLDGLNRRVAEAGAAAGTKLFTTSSLCLSGATTHMNQQLNDRPGDLPLPQCFRPLTLVK